MIIDVHTHIFPDDLAPKAMEQLQAGWGTIAYLDGTKADLLASMERAGIDKSVVCPVSTKPSQVQKSNDWVAALGDDRLIAFGTLFPGMHDPEAEVRRAVSMGIKGFKLHPEYQDFSPLEDRARPMLEAIARAGVPILFHAGIDVDIPTVHGTPRAFAILADRMPELVMILAHMGSYRMWDEVRRWLVGSDVYFDTSYVHEDMSHIEFSSLVRDHGVDKVLFGSDSPWGEHTAQIAGVTESSLDEAEVAAVLSGNAVRLLGL